MNESLQSKMDEASKTDDEINTQIESLKDRIKAYPENKEYPRELRLLYLKLSTMWKELAEELREEDSACSDEEEKEAIVKSIIFCQEMATNYKEESRKTTRSIIESSKSHKVGKVMQETGKAMQEHGDSMTRGCTIPLLIGLILFILLMMIL